MDDRPLSIRARKKVKAQMEKQERERMLALFHKRMELARAGAVLFRENKMREAAQNYYSYLDILEKTKGVPNGGLQPNQFDKQKDIAELLLLSGVFWDLAKMHDKSAKKGVDKVRFYLDRFVLFSKGFPYQKVSSELCRKYLVNGMPKNRKEFKDAHIALGGGKCFIATAVEDYCETDTLPQLRTFRNEVLKPNILGRGFITLYYWVGPPVARFVLRLPEGTQRKLAKFFDFLAQTIC